MNMPRSGVATISPKGVTRFCLGIRTPASTLRHKETSGTVTQADGSVGSVSLFPRLNRHGQLSRPPEWLLVLPDRQALLLLPELLQCDLRVARQLDVQGAETNADWVAGLPLPG